MSAGPLSLAPEQVRRLRQRAQRLAPRGEGSAESLLKEACPLQAQDSTAAGLGAAARSAGLRAGDLQAGLAAGRLVRTWLMRGTLHLAAAEDARWMLPLLAPPALKSGARRLKQLGWDGERLNRGLDLLERELHDSGGLTRTEAAERLRAAGLPSAGQAPYHLIFRAALEGRLAGGPEREGETVYRPWAPGAAPAYTGEAAVVELARRYLAAFAPAGLDDFARWSGLTRTAARQAWAALEGESVPVELAIPDAAGQPRLLESQLAWLDEWLDERHVERPEKRPLVRLLPMYDNLLLAYAGRGWLVAPEFAGRVHPGGGLLRAALLVDGRARATWGLRRRGAGYELSLDPFEPLDPDWQSAVQAEADHLARFLEVKVEPV